MMECWRRFLCTLTAVVALVCEGCLGATVEVHPTGMLECFQCYEGTGINNNAPLPHCSKLRNEPEFKVLCPNSTMCLKVVHTMNLLHGKTRTTETRGCANQVELGHKLVAKEYREVFFIREPYQVECTQTKTHSMVTTTTEHCYCRGNLCNGGSTRHTDNLSNITYVMFLLIYLAAIKRL